jgi:DNA-directed RNA polymerase subunit RPC12/RpoP
MTDTEKVLEYKCPCCNAPLIFGQDQQKMVCEYCDNTFEMEAVKAYNTTAEDPDEKAVESEQPTTSQWSEEDQEVVRTYTCSSCGGELITDDNTAATFCPYCDNPTIIQGRLSGGIRPDGVLPFKNGKEEAKAAFRKLCKGKLLLPKGFDSDVRVEKITGMYVPFWLYNCTSHIDGKYNATRSSSWSDSKYNYVRTDYYSILRVADATFSNIPMDASSKLSNTIMESIEPFDFSQVVDFETAYLSGYFADKYDVEAETGFDRIKQRVTSTMDQKVRETITGFSGVSTVHRNVTIDQKTPKYVLLPVWMLYTKFKDKTYVFAMNGQTGKMTGTFPICPKKSAMWFSGICAGVTLLATIVQLLAF